jgi:hypothetical protein
MWMLDISDVCFGVLFLCLWPPPEGWPPLSLPTLLPTAPPAAPPRPAPMVEPVEPPRLLPITEPPAEPRPPPIAASLRLPLGAPTALPAAPPTPGADRSPCAAAHLSADDVTQRPTQATAHRSRTVTRRHGRRSEQQPDSQGRPHRTWGQTTARLPCRWCSLPWSASYSSRVY